MTTTVRVSTGVRDRIMKVATQEYGGASVDETMQRLLDDHLALRAIEAMDRFRAEDPVGYADYETEAQQLAEAGLGDLPLDPHDDGQHAA